MSELDEEEEEDDRLGPFLGRTRADVEAFCGDAFWKVTPLESPVVELEVVWSFSSF